MEGQSLSTRARATLRQGEPGLHAQSFGGTGSAIPAPATQASEPSAQSGASGMLAGASSQITQQVSQRPWTALAVALATGYAIGSLGGSSSASDTGMYYDASHDRGTGDNWRTTSTARGEYPGALSGTSVQQSSWSNGDAKQPQASEPGMFSQLADQFDDQITTLKDTLLSTVLGLMHDTIRQDAPGLHQEIERVRRERGGQGSAGWAASPAGSAAQTDRSKDPFRKEHEQDMH